MDKPRIFRAAVVFTISLLFAGTSSIGAPPSTFAADSSTRLANTKKKPKPPKIKEDDNHLSEKGDRKLIHYKFPLPDSLKPNYEFWKLIYSQYDKNQGLLHDTVHLQVIYSVIDFNNPVEAENADDAEEGYVPPLSKREKIDAEKSKVKTILLKLAEGGYEEKDLNAEEKRIYHLFDTVEGSDKFAAAAERGRMRVQTGQKDKFLKAIEWSGKYLTEIEDIFTSHGLPVELTRLVFVESMFNLKARSKVGASGLWQFMPGTGRLFMAVNGIVDERNDPIQATHGAARLLLSNYELLGNWPLAVNAYNSGPQNLLRAKNELGTDDIGVIAKNYQGGGYKFASRNFYTEFLAALEVADQYKKYFGEIERLPRLYYEEVTLDTPTPLVELAGSCGVDLSTLEEMNPGFNRSYFSTLKPFPAGYTLKIPVGLTASFKKAVEEIAARRSGNAPVPVAVQ